MRTCICNCRSTLMAMVPLAHILNSALYHWFARARLRAPVQRVSSFPSAHRSLRPTALHATVSAFTSAVISEQAYGMRIHRGAHSGNAPPDLAYKW